jgi:hypothetical protein
MEWSENSERPGWFARLHLSWPMLLLAGWLLYEFTTQPGLAALVACAKFGWPDVSTAVWLRRADPYRRRGQTCFWCYLSFGTWKIAVMSTVTMILLVVVNIIRVCALGQPGGDVVFSMFLGSISAAVIGVGLLCLTTYVALWLARRHGIRIWMGNAPRRARQERFWPPWHGHHNAAPFVVATALGVTLLTLIGLLIVFILTFAAAQPWAPYALFFAVIAPPALILAIRDASKSVVARSPQECWGADAIEAVYEASAVARGWNEA